VRERADLRQAFRVSGWTSRVENPFREDPQFWSSVSRSVDAFWTLLIATALVIGLGSFAAFAFLVPAVLLAMAWRDARASTARTRPAFATRPDWQAGERQAVAAAIPGCLVRYFRR